ncbi:MAG: YhfC family intramembrane metalloprotease [Bradyrhizobiaceae bacterium]|nr:YhfC family intramembrane metalloprotease [Bradyrhizobiaceae bacterium]
MVSTPILAAVAASALLSLVWPVATFVVCRRRMILAPRNILIGAGVFLVFSLVLETATHVYLLKLNPATAAWLNGSPIIYALYGALAAALFEEGGRYFGMRVLVRPTGHPGTEVAYGLGHGGIESILIGGLSMLSLFVTAILLNAGMLDAVPAPDLEKIRATLQHLSMMSPVVGSLERLSALLIQIGLSLVVWRAVEERRMAWLALAIVFHAAVDFAAGLFQKGLISLVMSESLVLVIGAVLAVIFLRALPGKAVDLTPTPSRSGVPQAP